MQENDKRREAIGRRVPLTPGPSPASGRGEKARSAPGLKRRKKAPPTLIGWREWAAFPDLGVGRIKAKLDTGAKTSAIHAFRIKTFERDGALYADFILHPEQKKKRPEVYCTAPVVDRRAIRSSNGVVEKRLIIRTSLKLGDIAYPVDLSLTNRDAMGFRLLLGRDAIRRKFAIDPGKSFLLGRPPFDGSAQ